MDSSEGTARPRPGPDLSPRRARVAALPRSRRAGVPAGRIPLIPVTRTEARFTGSTTLPGMPSGKAAQVLAVVPDGYRADRRGRRWLRHCRATDAYTALRADYRARVDVVLDFLAAARQFDHGILRPGLEQFRLLLPAVCERTLYRILDTLVQARWIARVQRGSTERYRGVQDGLGALACEFVLIMPTLLISVRPKRFSSRNRSFPLHARERTGYPHNSRPHHLPAKAITAPLRGPDLSGPADAGQRRPEEGAIRRAQSWPARKVATTRRDRLTAVAALQAQAPDLRTVSDRSIRSALRPWHSAGWTNWDIGYALDHTPGGVAHHFGGSGHRVRHPLGWIRSRLSLWLAVDAAGAVSDQPGLSPTARRAVAAEQERASARTRADAIRRPVLSPEQSRANLAAATAARAAVREILATKRRQRFEGRP